MNWDKIKRENQSFKLLESDRNKQKQYEAEQRIKEKTSYGWWTQYRNEWYIAIDSRYKIGPERIVQVKKKSGEIISYQISDSPFEIIDYSGGFCSLFKGKKIDL